MATADSATTLPPRPVMPMGWQMFLSLVLIVHLFALFVACFANGGPNFVGRLKSLFGPYLQTLHMDLNYRFFHTYGDESDTGFGLTAEVRLRDGKTVNLDLLEHAPAGGMRRLRYFRLARQIFQWQENAELQGYLAQAIATGLLTDLHDQGITNAEIQSMVIRVRMHLLLDRSEVASGVREDRPQQYRDIYIGDVIPTGGLPIVNRRVAASERAPAVRPNTTPNTNTAPAATATP